MVVAEGAAATEAAGRRRPDVFVHNLVDVDKMAAAVLGHVRKMLRTQGGGSRAARGPAHMQAVEEQEQQVRQLVKQVVGEDSVPATGGNDIEEESATTEPPTVVPGPLCVVRAGFGQGIAKALEAVAIAQYQAAESVLAGGSLVVVPEVVQVRNEVGKQFALVELAVHVRRE